ncbi:acetoin reductase family protein [Gloeopeniophorella convolvens]|nr:acetoin reductase family protein [Gloeopeniophorella convolvens]
MVSAIPKVALVTGAARGIGRAIALQLADDGFDVAVNDLPNTPELDQTVAEIEGKGRRSLAIPADVSLEVEVERMIQRAVGGLGSLDVMVANAGIVKYDAGILNCTVEDFDRIMAINARGTMLCYKHAAKQMISQGRGGRIIGASSGAGKQGYDVITSYSASKFAVRGLTQAAARELGKHGITVNAYAPGTIDTRMMDDFNTLYAEKLGPNAAATVAATAPIGRMGTPEDIAGLVSYIASEKSSFITGQSLSINGGLFFD